MTTSVETGTARFGRPIAWGLWFLGMAVVVATLVLVWLNGSLEEDAWFVAVALLFIFGYVTTGAVLASRVPRNPIGWLFIAAGLGFLVGGLTDEWGRYALIVRAGELPVPDLIAWLAAWGSVMAALIPLIFILFPNGRPPSAAWRPVVGLLVAGIALVLFVSMFMPGTVTFGEASHSADVPKPFTLGFLGGTPGEVLAWTGGLAVLVGTFAAVASLVVRFRRAAAEERQQIRWVATAAAAAGVTLIVTVVTGIAAGEDQSSTANDVAFFTLLAVAGIGVPVATGVGVLKYRLYDLQLVVKKTLVFAVVATVLTAIYLVLLFSIPALFLGIGTDSGLRPWQVVVTLVVALSFAPVRRLARRLADRIVYGGRATPYEVLSDFSERLGETYSTDDVLPRMAQLLGASTGAAEVAILLKIGNRLVPSTTWTARSGDRASVGEGEQGVTDASAPDQSASATGSEESFPVVHQGEELGAIILRMTARDPMDPSKEQLVRDVASQAGLVLRNVRLINDLRESRRRIVAAQDERAKSLERNIHDGAQQQLVALTVKLRLAEQLAARDPDATAAMLRDLREEATGALEDLRDLARGIYPPLLADKGLAAALEGQARKSVVSTTVDADGVGRYPEAVESAVYFCVLEAMNNIAKYANASRVTIALSEAAGSLEVTVEDDGAGFDVRSTSSGTGLQGMVDRLDAIGGSLAIESEPGAGTKVRGSIPVA